MLPPPPPLTATPTPAPYPQATLAAEIRAARAEGKYVEGVSDLPGQDISRDGEPQVQEGRGGRGWAGRGGAERGGAGRGGTGW